jgi:hypothetical protein
MKKIFLILLLGILAQPLFAQNIGEVDLKEINNYGLKKLKDAPKKVFIGQFRLNFQTMYLDTEKKSGGFRGGSEYTRSYKSDVSASLAIGLKGLNEQDLIDITNKLYEDLEAKFKAEGYEIIPASKAGTIESLNDWEKRVGGKLNQSQYEGYVSVVPTGFEYLVRNVKDDGKEKGNILNRASAVSKELDGALVMIVNITIPFAQEAESGGSKMLGKLGGGAKVVAETGLMVSNNALDVSGTTQFYANGSSVISIYAKQSMSNINVGNWILKKPITIDGVIEKKKFKVEESAKVDWGTDAGFFKVYDVDDRFMSKVQALQVNSEKYKAGVFDAASKYINTVWQEIASNLK